MWLFCYCDLVVFVDLFSWVFIYCGRLLTLIGCGLVGICVGYLHELCGAGLCLGLVVAGGLLLWVYVVVLL